MSNLVLWVNAVGRPHSYTRAVRRGRTLEHTQKEIDFADFIRRCSGGDLVRTGALNSFYTQPGVQRAYEEAKFMSQGPMLPPYN